MNTSAQVPWIQMSSWSASEKQRRLSSSSHQSCRFISSHTTLEEQAQCLATKVSKLSLTGGKTLHPCRLNEDTNKVKLRPKQLIKKSCVVSRLSAVSITETVVSRQQQQQQTRQRPVSTGDIVDKKKQLTLNKEKKNSCNEEVVQLLHPDWRRIPWILYLGWTDAHRDLCKHLQSQARRGMLESIYYKSAKEHCAAGMTWRYHHSSDSPFLGGPAVNTVREVLEMIRREHSRDVTSHQLTDAVGPGYDGDDEYDV